MILLTPQGSGGSGGGGGALNSVFSTTTKKDDERTEADPVLEPSRQAKPVSGSSVLCGAGRRAQAVWMKSGRAEEEVGGDS